MGESILAQRDDAWSRYGGNMARQVDATGFFCTKLIDDRWWLVDPDGYLYIDRSITSVRMQRSAEARQAFLEIFGDEETWASRTTALLREHGFTGLGSWSDVQRLRNVDEPLVYTINWNFMSSYGRERGGTRQLSGRTGHPNGCILVFDPEFEEFADRHARQLAETKDDPWLLGHFSDNELQLPPDVLRRYLELPADDHGHKAARAWLIVRHGPDATEADITGEDMEDFQALVVERYYRIVSEAIKRHDPNHLYLGTRFHGWVTRQPKVFASVGPYVDVVSVDYYHTWTPDPERMRMWNEQSGKPILITEWYVMGEDSGMANATGAGWIVPTQEDRGRFYQNYALGLLESRVCVGWQWFKYGDNDPADRRADPSNINSNKGITTNRYQPYKPLLEAMKELNERVYTLVDHMDAQVR